LRLVDMPACVAESCSASPIDIGRSGSDFSVVRTFWRVVSSRLDSRSLISNTDEPI
jgi:hypothetical protein